MNQLMQTYNNSQGVPSGRVDPSRSAYLVRLTSISKKDKGRKFYEDFDNDDDDFDHDFDDKGGLFTKM